MDQQAPPLPPHQPLTFAERGVAFLATTQLLLGTRVRRGQLGLEFIVPNPAGGRGVYVLSWRAVKDLWHPTIHDRLLHDELEPATAVTPDLVRNAARAVASRGAAGQPAQQSAERFAITSAEALANTRRHLSSRADIEGVKEMDALIMVLTGIGVGPSAAQARIPLLLAQIAALRDETQACAETHGDASGALKLLGAAADQAIATGSHVLTDARANLQDLPTLLRSWGDQWSDPGLMINRPDWMLDGWELPCLIWHTAGTVSDQLAAVQEICGLLPILPREAAQWAGLTAGPPAASGTRRTVGINKDWRTGLLALANTARNERLRAWAA